MIEIITESILDSFTDEPLDECLEALSFAAAGFIKLSARDTGIDTESLLQIVLSDISEKVRRVN